MDKYEKVRKIGEGSFGKAILVKSREDGKQYVIKEIGISRMSSKERQESRKEVAVLANMSHPNIVQYKESFEECGCLYIVMDYCEGGDLFKTINSQKGVQFPEEQILDWLVQICLALKHVHDRKILHRDIKSQNIFLTKDGTIQLGDFGIARVLNSTVELARTCIGTPYYLSPEICENKPYNNKSDVWALGCVLYEMCTLKHAFEAGNMKNLVLKIIRGSYPPVSIHYSQDLRSLMGQLFRRNPRERPSVSSILDKPFLSHRIFRFLTPEIIAQEFSHSFLHKQPKAGVAQAASAKRRAPAPMPVTPAQKITKPAAKYGVPLNVRKASDAAMKPAEWKPAVKHKMAPVPLPAVPQRRVSRVEEERRKYEEGARKKRMELIEKERKQREQMFLLKAGQMKRYEREKINRINRAREQGWRHVLSSSGGSSPERKCFVGGGGMMAGFAAPVPEPLLPAPCPVQGPTPGPAPLSPSRGPYEHYHAALDQLAKPQPKEGAREGFTAGGDTPVRGVPAAASSVLPNGPARLPDPDVVKRELRRLEYVTKQTHVSRQRGHAAAERANQVQEFLQRKRDAMLNKVRAEGQLGARQNLAAIYGRSSYSRPKPNKEEEEYLSRLRQIRLQNFNERQQIKARLRGVKYDSDGSDSKESCEETELRRKKIEALKAQAQARAAVLKEQLEKKRREAYEREKRAWEDHLAARGVKVGMVAGGVAVELAPPPRPGPSLPVQDVVARAQPASKPSTPVISMTSALKDVGAQLASVQSSFKDDFPKTDVIKSEKKEILRRLNQNLKAQSPEEEVSATPSEELCPTPQQSQPIAEERPSSGGDRKKWEAVAPSILSVAQQTLEETCIRTTDSQALSPEERPSSGVDRKKWEAVAPSILSVAQQTLEETCIRTTGSQALSPEERPSSGGDRKKWEAGSPSILSVAQQTLEDTCIRTAEQTVGEVIRMDVLQDGAPRKAWGRSPDSQVLRVLQEADLQPLTQLLGNVNICEEKLTDNLNQTAKMVGVSGTKEVMHSEASPPAVISVVKNTEVQDQEEGTISVDVTGQEKRQAILEEMLKTPPKPIEMEDPADLESVVLEECPKQASNSPAGVVQAWEKRALPLGPPEGRVTPAETKEVGEKAEKQPESSGIAPVYEEPLFVKLCSSPAHRRTAALVLMSAQSSMEDSSSSLASRSRSVSPLRSKHHNALLIGLSTGQFDANNPKMLRTCSLPDLSRLFSSLQEAGGANGAVAPDNDNNLDIEDMEEEEEEEAKEDEQSETEDVYEDDDLRELRASMERLLQEERSEEDEGGSGSNSGSPPEEEGGDGFNGNPAEDEDDEELNGMAVDEEEGSNGSPGDEEAGHTLTNGLEEEEHHSSESQLNEEWQSDDSGEEEDGAAEQQDSIFSRLEELRFNLEQEMGFENFIEAYNKIKAIHEDEDENIDMGPDMVLNILGTEHQHLYPNILHLVMADGAYQEDNDE
ncbi:serine/threonine-protein kinase Nek1 isoform X1 [Oncorhynchus kisutch]|uniref:serine/threonine-protein kinase Nek1 isoform X1 n=1 Tax=Oncorhynchus kisutch TaxID=8019 RepID=UPI0012DF3AB4|nr:serine/threonine-protein kinase Nek1 isoform X1 [Oncorhynchus kisutch]